MAARPPDFEPFSPATQRQATPWPADQLGDLVHLHWIADWIDDAARQALVYSAADMFVLPSLEDKLPQTGMESLAACIDQLADNPALRGSMSHQARLFAERNYDQRKHAARYLSLYERLTSETKSRCRWDSQVA